MTLKGLIRVLKIANLAMFWQLVYTLFVSCELTN